MLLSYRHRFPEVPPSSFVEESARVIGDVTLGEEVSIWFNVVIRGDINSIRIGNRTNIQDGTVIHVSHDIHPTWVGDEVTVGHNVTLHGCTIGNRCLIGMGAVLLDGVVLGDESKVAAGSVVPPGTVVPPRSLVMGMPARVSRTLSDQEISDLKKSAENYVRHISDYRTAD